MSSEVSNFTEDGICYTDVNGVSGTLNPMDSLILKVHAQNIEQGGKYIETGSYLGCSAILVALNSNATVWAHDIWVSEWSELAPTGRPPPEVRDYFFKFYSAVKSNNLVNRVIPIRGNSVYTIGIHDDESIDLAFIDGDHSYEGCLGDLEVVFPKMKNSGTILVHDCIPDSEPLKAVKHFAQTHNLSVGFYPRSWGMAKIDLSSTSAPK
jgi:hypothetical protein